MYFAQSSLLISTLFLVFRSSWGYLFNNDPKVVALVASVLPLVSLFHVFDATAVVAGGVLRARGKQVSSAMFLKSYTTQPSAVARSCLQPQWVLLYRHSIGFLFRIQASLWAAWPMDGTHLFINLLCGTRNRALFADRLGQGGTEGARQVERRGQAAQSSFRRLVKV